MDIFKITGNGERLLTFQYVKNGIAYLEKISMKRKKKFQTGHS